MYITECESDIVEEIETRLTESDEASADTCNGTRKTSSFETPWSDKVTSNPIEDFCSEVGPTVEIPETPLDIFLLFFTPESLKHIEEFDRCLNRSNLVVPPYTSHLSI